MTKRSHGSKLIRLSKKHGVNPTIPTCFYCGEKKNEIILAGELPGDAEAPKDAVWDHVPCDQCKRWMQKGVIVISIRDGETGENPYRTGGWVVLTESAVRKFASPMAVQDMLRSRVCFMPDEVWDHLKLPRDKAFVGLPKSENN